MLLDGGKNDSWKKKKNAFKASLGFYFPLGNAVTFQTYAARPGAISQFTGFPALHKQVIVASGIVFSGAADLQRQQGAEL